MPTSNGAPCGVLTACHYKAIGHGLITNFMNICQPMRLGDFLANKKIQELNFVYSVERDSLKILAVIIPNGIICLLYESPLLVFMNISSRYNWVPWQSTNSWCCYKHHDVCTFAPCTSRDPTRTRQSRMRIRPQYKFRHQACS
jgi:hypothetical protein